MRQIKLPRTGTAHELACESAGSEGAGEFEMSGIGGVIAENHRMQPAKLADRLPTGDAQVTLVDRPAGGKLRPKRKVTLGRHLAALYQQQVRTYVEPVLCHLPHATHPSLAAG